ncbi:hypothetical protein JCM5350_007367 [Sporobolomyces pararoseus]
MSHLLHLYQGTPFLKRAQTLNEIVQLLLTAPDVRLIQLWARNIHDTFNAMHHKLLSPDYDSRQRTSVAQAESVVAERLEQVRDGIRSYLSNVVSQVQVEEMLCKGRLTSFEQLIQGCQLDPRLLPTKSWFEEVVADYTFRESRKKTDYARPQESDLRNLVLDLWGMRSSCEHGMSVQDHCHLCRDHRRIFTSRCHNILTTFVTYLDWNSLNVVQKRELVRIVATMKENLEIVIDEGQVPLEFFYLWILPIDVIRVEIQSLVAEDENDEDISMTPVALALSLPLSNTESVADACVVQVPSVQQPLAADQNRRSSVASRGRGRGVGVSDGGVIRGRIERRRSQRHRTGLERGGSSRENHSLSHPAEPFLTSRKSCLYFD